MLGIQTDLSASLIKKIKLLEEISNDNTEMLNIKTGLENKLHDKLLKLINENNKLRELLEKQNMDDLNKVDVAISPDSEISCRHEGQQRQRPSRAAGRHHHQHRRRRQREGPWRRDAKAR